MARLARLDEGLFPVGWQPLYARIDGRNMNVTGREVIVHQKGRIAGVISHADRLFLRKQALGGGSYRALTVIVQTMRGKLRVADVDAQSTSNIGIVELYDLVQLDIRGVPDDVSRDAAGAFARISGSRNCGRAPAWDIRWPPRTTGVAGIRAGSPASPVRTDLVPATR